MPKFVQDRNLKDSILNENPVPTNITKLRKLDEYYKELLEENSAKSELAIDSTQEKIQSKTLNIMWSLSKLFSRFDQVLAQENNMLQLDLNELTQYLEQSVMVVGQAFNVITYIRRLNVHSAVKDEQKAKKYYKR